MTKRGGARPGAGRPAQDPWRDISLGGEIDAALKWVSSQRRLRAQRQSAWVQFVLRQIEAADAQTRRDHGLGEGPLEPGSSGLLAVIAARKNAWDRATKRRPAKRKDRPASRLYDKRLSAWLMARIARRYGVSADVARAALAAWRKASAARPKHTPQGPYTDDEG